MEIIHVCLEDAKVHQPSVDLSVLTPKLKTVQCCVFLDQHAPENCVMCPNGHHVSQTALSRYVQMELEKPLEYHRNLQGLKCPKCDLCFEGESVCSLLTPELSMDFQELRKKCKDKEKFEEEVADKEDLETYHDLIRGQFQTSKGEYVNCFMCPDCGYGPIDKKACDDMAAHHFQRIGDHFIDNSCPMCHFYSRHIRDWKKWDGSFLPQPAIVKMQTIAEKVTSEFGGYILEIQQQYDSVEVDSQAKWEKCSSEYRAHLAETKRMLAENGVRPAHVISAEMADAYHDPELLARLGAEFHKSLRIHNPRTAAAKFGTVPLTVEAWIKKEKKKLGSELKNQRRTLQGKIHECVLSAKG